MTTATAPVEVLHPVLHAWWCDVLRVPLGTTDAEIDQLVRGTLRLNGYMSGKIPTGPQIAFMVAWHPEVLFGGAAGPGKSTGLLLAALQYVDIPGYAALIVRRTFQQLAKPGGLMSKAREWLEPTNAKWNDETRTWRFPSGATLTFGHLENPGTGPNDLGDEQNFQGQEYQFIGPDELTQLPTAWPYLYLMTRLRRLKGAPVPVRMRPTTNPGGVGHAWVKARFITQSHADRLFLPAKGKDNPHLDWVSYLRGLGQLDGVTQAQLIDGRWDVEPQGDLFRPERIRVLSPAEADAIRQGVGVQQLVLYWDKAGTADGGAYTAGVLMARVDRALYHVGFVVVDVIRGQWSPGKRNMVMRQAVGIVRPGEPLLVPVPVPLRTVVWIEQEPGSGGLESAQLSVNDLAGPGVEVHIERATGSKIDRARPYAAQVEGYNVGICDGPHVGPYLDELRPAPNGVYWDQIDGSSGGYNKLALLLPPSLPAGAPGRGRQLALPGGGAAPGAGGWHGVGVPPGMGLR